MSYPLKVALILNENSHRQSTHHWRLAPGACITTMHASHTLTFCSSALPVNLQSASARPLLCRKWTNNVAKSRRPYRFGAPPCVMSVEKTSEGSTSANETEVQTSSPSTDAVSQTIDSEDAEEDDFDIPEKTQPQPSKLQSSSSSQRYSLRTRLREEIEAPFRKARMFVYFGSAASAGVGAFISGLRVIAALSGISGVQPLSETIPNVAVDVGVIGLCAFLLRRETLAGEKRLERMSRGARIAKLRLEDMATRQVVNLKGVRGSKRIVVVAGRADLVKDALEEAIPSREQLEESSLRVVPLVAEGTEDVTPEDVLRGWRFVPYAQEDWMRWYAEEQEIFKKRMEGREDVLVIVIRLDGKVGARSIGKPVWSKLIDEVQRLPPKDQYGKP